MLSSSSQARVNPKSFRVQSDKRPPREIPCPVHILLNHASRGRLPEALSYLDVVVRKGIRLPSLAIAYLLQQCGNARSLRGGKWVHLHIKRTGFKKPTTFIANHLIIMYFKCGDEVEARKVFDKMAHRNIYSWNNMLSGYAKLGMIRATRRLFDKMPEKDVVSWNTMVISYAQSGRCEEALMFYREFRKQSIGFNAYSFAGVLTVCVKLKELQLTRQVFGQILVAGFLSNVVLSSSIVDVFARCGEIGEARRLFDSMGKRDVPCWTTMVSGYARWGDMISARDLFDRMPEKNPVSWTALISGYVRNGLGTEALELFTKMMRLQVRPDQYTFSCCLCACASISALKHGKQIHSYLMRSNFRPNTIVVSSLIDMYSKCGMLPAGLKVFSLMGDKQDVVLWNTMISALAQHGHGKKAIQMFDDMIKRGLKPDRISFVVILCACSHSGLVEDGIRFFRSMASNHGVVPDPEHYSCLIDLLGRAGRFDELMNHLKNMRCKPDDRVWNALLGVCRIHGNLELGIEAAEQVIELAPQSSSAYVLLASIYGTLGRWEYVEKVRSLMDRRRVRKECAMSWIEVENKVHSFIVSDRLHPSKEEIYSLLKQLAGHIEQDSSILY